MKSAHFKHSKSRPLWYTINHSPVFILGGIEDEKTILLSDTSFQDYSLVEVSDARQTVGLGFWTELNGVWSYRMGPQRHAHLQKQGMKKNFTARKQGQIFKKIHFLICMYMC